ncbi:hypothetical protein HWV62_38282 [Athelia sp. TMB]|nr:hypothetical protein HWV62_38282 [Athelia sp. TMB]
MFKKPLSNLKTSAPLRSSDRRKLKQRVLQAFPHIGEQELVPDGLLSIKFSTHLDEPGVSLLFVFKALSTHRMEVAYLDPNGDPLWFTVGKGSDDLIPTVYTLWKKPDLLPTLTTPAAVIPVLTGGADLMIPGVVEIPTSPPLQPHQLVAVAQYHPTPKAGAPLAVGWMAASGEEVRTRAEEEGEGRKGKAVLVVHAWRDCLWEMGAGGEVPEPRDVGTAEVEVEAGEGENPAIKQDDVAAGDKPDSEEPAVIPEASGSTLSPQGM